MENEEIKTESDFKEYTNFLIKPLIIINDIRSDLLGKVDDKNYNVGVYGQFNVFKDSLVFEQDALAACVSNEFNKIMNELALFSTCMDSYCTDAKEKAAYLDHNAWLKYAAGVKMISK